VTSARRNRAQLQCRATCRKVQIPRYMHTCVYVHMHVCVRLCFSLICVCSVEQRVGKFRFQGTCMYYAYIYTCMCVCASVFLFYMLACAQTHKNSFTYTHTYTHTHMHTLIQRHTYVYSHTYTHTGINRPCYPFP
jgi:hypothetical protein